MTILKTVDNKLVLETEINGTACHSPVLEGYESSSGWFWFIVEKDAYGKGIHYGYVQGMYEEWGSISQDELDSMPNKIWKINEQSLPYAGRR